DPGTEIDAGLPSLSPRVDMSGDGDGVAVSQIVDNGVAESVLDHNAFGNAGRLDTTGSTVPSAPDVATGDRGDSAVAGPAGLTDGGLVAPPRVKPYRQPFSGEATISNPALGPVDDPGVFISGDRTGDFAVAMVQGSPGAEALTVASYDDPP